MYKISKSVLNRADVLGVQIKPSTNKTKKIDVFKSGVKVASIGSIGYQDFYSYIDSDGKKYADERRRLYKIRHEKDRLKKGSPGYYADKLLWS